MTFPLQIAMLVPGMPFNGDALNKQSLGGSETAGLCMARELAALGDVVHVFCNCDRPGIYDGVYYYPADNFGAYASFVPHDVTIIQRLPDTYANPTNSKLNILWCHDLAHARYANNFKATLWNMDRALVLSKFMKTQYIEAINPPDEDLLWVTRNGIDLSLFKSPLDKPRDRNKLMWAARPERGLDVMLRDIFPKMLAAKPDLKLHIAGYANTVDRMRAFYDQLAVIASQFGDSIVPLGALNKTELYEHYRTAALYVYPTPGEFMPEFREISCISMMEAMAAGLPVVTSNQGALPETLHKDAGVLIEGTPADAGYVDRFVSESVRLLDDRNAWKRASKAGEKAAKRLSWKAVAHSWHDAFVDWIVANNDNTERLAIHQRKLGDCGGVPMPTVAKPKNEPVEGFEKARGEAIANWRKQNTGPVDFIFGLETETEPWTTARMPPAGAPTCVVTPYGPWSPDLNWNFEFFDLHDMMGKKPEASIRAFRHSIDETTRQALGFHLTYFVSDGQPLGKIDLDRKLAIQRPRQTVSATIMCGGPEAKECLHWCLTSINPYVDQIVIADDSMDAEARRIAEQYDVEFVDAPSPLEAGFETPRNIALGKARHDWVLWIDADEKLIDGPNMNKFLRENCFQGYSIRQHNFACDTKFEPDMPVRLFRRRPRDGKTMRHFGMIHEHPELALNEGPGPTIVLSDVHIAHLGYLAESRRRDRFWRNHPLLLKDMEKYPDRLLQKHFIMRDNMLKAGYELTQNGGVLTSDMKALCEETIRLYREHFLGKPSHVGSPHPLDYYSQALRMMGKGFDVSFEVQAARDGMNQEALNGHQVMRFENQDDLTKELLWRAREATNPYTNPHW